MLKNVRLKKFLKNSVFKPLSALNQILPKKENEVMFYIATGGIQFNLKPVLEYMLSHGYAEKYHIVCGVENSDYFEKSGGKVEYIAKMKAIFHFLTTKHVFYTAGQIPIKPSKKQEVIHLTHGATYYKAMGALSNINNGDEFFFNHMITTGEYFRPIVQKAYCCRAENVAICNEPITDQFFQETPPYDLGECDKMILWMPTFRQSEALGYDNSSTEEALILFSESDYEELNAYLQKKNIRLIVKLHPAQDIKNYHLGQFSHLMIYSHQSFQQSGYEIYRLMKQADALIGDYSSASLQYLLLNRPMAFVVPDLEDYQAQRGFVFENPLDFMPGNIIRTKEEFYTFLDEMISGTDAHKAKREHVRDIIHQYQDGKACERILHLSGIHL